MIMQNLEFTQNAPEPGNIGRGELLRTYDLFKLGLFIDSSMLYKKVDPYIWIHANHNILKVFDTYLMYEDMVGNKCLVGRPVFRMDSNGSDLFWNLYMDDNLKLTIKGLRKIGLYNKQDKSVIVTPCRISTPELNYAFNKIRKEQISIFKTMNYRDKSK